MCLSAQYKPLSLPIGIDTRNVPLAGSKGSQAYNNGFQAGVRKRGDKDATRYLENAVKENNVERVGKLLDAGASAYVSYDMIDNKQYEIMELMHKNNPQLIRFSQMIHYACANSDNTMVDFLIAHDASLDLCGNYWETYPDNNYGRLAVRRCEWNSDNNLYYTPLDCALRSGNTSIINYVIQKYGKRPTIIGVTDYLYRCICNDKSDNNSVEDAFNRLPELDEYLGGNSLTKVFNTGIGYIHRGKYAFKYLLIEAINKMGEYKDASKEKKAAQLENFIKYMIENNTDVKVNTDYCSVLYMGIGDEVTLFETPMYVAMRHKGMLDIIHLLKAKGASMKIKASQKGRTGEIPLEKTSIRDEYKELILTKEL